MKKIFIVPIRLYQLFLSPIFPPACRFIPSCSQYAIDAIEAHGPFKGLLMSLRRVMRCHPWNQGGFDPVKK